MGDYIRKMLLIALLLIACTSGYCDEEISYPPKPPETTIKEMVDAGKGLAKETKELSKAMINGVKEDGGVIATVKKHKKFYGGIFVFGLLYLVWLKTRDK